MAPKDRNAWWINEQTGVVIALAGPAIVILSMIPSLLAPSNLALAGISDTTGVFGVVFSYVSFVTSIIWLFNRWKNGSRKLHWPLLVVLNSLIVAPITVMAVTGKLQI